MESVSVENMTYRPFSGGVASRSATAIYVAMVTLIYMTIQISNMSYQP